MNLERGADDDQQPGGGAQLPRPLERRHGQQLAEHHHTGLQDLATLADG